MTYGKRGTDVSVSSSVSVTVLHVSWAWRLTLITIFCTDSEREDSWLHRRRPLRHVYQKESHVYWPGHWGQHLSPQGKSMEEEPLVKWYASLPARTCQSFYALQVKSSELFEEWVSKLRHHRLFRQNEIAVYPHERHLFHPHASSSPTFNDSYRRVNVHAILVEI